MPLHILPRTLKSGLVWAGLLVILGVLGLCTDVGQGFLKGDPPPDVQPADAVVVLAGRLPEDRQRLERGMQLVSQGTAHFLILPLRVSGLDWPRLLRLHDLPYEIPPQQVIVGRPEKGGVTEIYGGTFTEAVNTVQIMRTMGLHSAIVVSSDYHMRRVRLAFAQADPHRTMAFTYLPVDTHPATGLLSQLRYRIRLFAEYGKLLGAYCMYPAGRRWLPVRHGTDTA